MDWLLAGLGNPGAEYARTRHNAGFWALQTFAEKAGASLRLESRWHCLAATTQNSGQQLGLCLPQDFMNRSGAPVQSMAAFYKVPAARILVIHDELDLPPGTARLKWSGGHGGHNGLRDLDRALGTRDYWRLRLGIGHPGHKNAVINYVLGVPSAMDKSAIDLAIEHSLAVLPEFLDGRSDAAQKTLHSD
ncbi:aminoacyl-tRNA hydrolase [Acidithiobacillus sp. HP-6]|uniref:aminoacyl-tRNA hydrolase n=1 Tax=unclassified Acidithiobacillus TaxID=2614800 RepID=UPI001879477F|nr:MULTISPECIES: aminoacyl-tRNA hydrolase [unclassified Acidithiobacillus]MBE7563818.1 aminoacyl-tRNA hydrolase [Acidithiobacillus sp. HP-6]MBE7570437.1 aminoacyl-tRNA hydrolase [Acidithiobacillus sp. HP-2]MDD2750868.1 aminoacyl-tRNA hydrolase [Acidithiobacillus sp.]MDD5279839.1 aminoacyl-tRNA hydrolase [Acidithiobacillus sp.]